MCRSTHEKPQSHKQLAVIDDETTSTRTSAIDSVLRWAGSKKKLLPLLIRSAPKVYNRYYEPFLGSGALFFSLVPCDAVIGDLNSDLIRTFAILRQYPIKLYTLLNAFPRTKRDYYRVRSSKPNDAVLRAARFLYLNRLCFNGLYRTNRSGDFNVPYGSDAGAYPSLACFRRAAAQLRKARLLPGDFEDTLASAGKHDFVYIDPPYVYSDRKDRGEYGANSFACADLPRLRKTLTMLDRKKAFFLLSYLECDDIKSHLNGWNVTRIPVRRQIASFVSKRIVVNEVLVSNY